MNPPSSGDAPVRDFVPLGIYLRLEGFVSLVAATTGFAHFSFSWWLYGVLFLAPDLFMFGYLGGPRVGATMYNLGHTYLAPAVLLLASLFFGSSTAGAVGLIWWAHIGFDRSFGFGLKHDSAFKSTHFNSL